LFAEERMARKYTVKLPSDAWPSLDVEATGYIVENNGSLSFYKDADEEFYHPSSRRTTVVVAPGAWVFVREEGQDDEQSS
jgi:hypothetical protein